MTTSLHRLRGVSDGYGIVAGIGRVELGGLGPAEVSAGDVVRIPSDTPQRITSIGASDLVFYCVCTPALTPSGYESLA
jgi:mannose-6-phosphate isomerase-like protein (cupin superfamily)